MFAEKLVQIAAVQMLLLDELQPHDVVVGAGIVQIAVGAQFQQAT